MGVLGALPTPQLLDTSPGPGPHVGLSEDGSQACWEDRSLHSRTAPSVAEAPRVLAPYSAARSGKRTWKSR